MWKVLLLLSLVGPVYPQRARPEETDWLSGAPENTTEPAMGVNDRMKRLTPKTTKKKVYRRTTPPRVSFPENCDYLAFYCLKAYLTGRVCARTVRYTYRTFKNYCMLDFVNCMEKYDLWQAVYMGDCIDITPLKEYGHYPYEDDLFLDDYYIIEDVRR